MQEKEQKIQIFGLRVNLKSQVKIELNDKNPDYSIFCLVRHVTFCNFSS